MVDKYEIIIMEVGLEDRYKMGLTGSFKGCSGFPFPKDGWRVHKYLFYYSLNFIYKYFFPLNIAYFANETLKTWGDPKKVCTQ